jgi:hypothetical protein
MTQKEKWKKGVGKEDCVVASGAGNHRGRRRASNEAGQVLLLTALAMIVLIGFLALATDVGYGRYVKRNMQKAADAGAIGGATELIYNVGNIDFGAKRDTSLNGFTHTQEGVIVTVNHPPLSGRFIGLPEYVEVIIAQDQPTFFAKIFNITSYNVIARAVAYGGLKPNTQADGCIFTLDPDGNPSFHVGGNNTSVEVDCGIVVNSDSDNCALLIAGNSTVHATGISVVGDSCTEGANTDVTPEPMKGTAADDPLSYLNEEHDPPYIPTYSPSCPPERTNVNVNTDCTLLPGVYCGGIRISSSGLTVNFDPGLYILHDGGFQVHTGGSTLLGHDVTFYNTGSSPDYGGAITINANAGTELSATDHLAASGQGSPQSIPGVLFWQDKYNTKEATFNGNSNTLMEGAFYFPGADAKFDGGNSTETGYALVVAQNVKFTGSATFHITNESSGSGGSGGPGPVARVVLVE